MKYFWRFLYICEFCFVIFLISLFSYGDTFWLITLGYIYFRLIYWTLCLQIEQNMDNLVIVIGAIAVEIETKIIATIHQKIDDDFAQLRDDIDSLKSEIDELKPR